LNSNYKEKLLPVEPFMGIKTRVKEIYWDQLMKNDFFCPQCNAPDRKIWKSSLHTIARLVRDVVMGGKPVEKPEQIFM
jgi:hypothetical protein